MKYDTDTIKQRKKINNILKRTFQYITLILTIVLIYNIVLVLKSNINYKESKGLFGYQGFIITTDSMKPNINEGDVVVISKCKEKDLKVGNVISFKSIETGEIITHRISEIEEKTNKTLYVTKGDNNNIEDSEKITFEQIQGKQVITLPKLGKIIEFLQNKFIIAIFIVVIIFTYIYLKKNEEKRNARREKKKIEDKKYKKQKINNEKNNE